MLNDPHMICIRNNGIEIEETNFWDSILARKGYCYVSINASALRLLVPPVHEMQIEEMKTGKKIIVSRGPWPRMGQTDAFEILFDDGSENPFSLHFGTESFDRLPPRKEIPHQLTLSIWIQSLGGKPQCVWSHHCHYREVARLPCLKP